MRRRVYRSLDRPATVFGVRGRFLWVMALGGALSLIAGLIAGALAGMLAGTGAALIALGAAYLGVLSLQSRVAERDLVKVIVKRSYPALYRVRPKHIRNLWKGFNLSPRREGASRG